ncbi:M42 family metallopeptidase [Ferroacidibacillus organovorans]|uniref:Aminopeptidase n=1 Tax=Ferroacidibacillus organovorans TaxID=1765683 RepID=A0A161QF39_9BACL|nr:M20/M25/M40 family metallo-hydrolase [Ferroacidibacillus organovorans]KYP80510.1 hypothetical protein AYJ22_02395 [Ferroacidibacillus organovorans]OAG94738.1 hypothetical protein AYW79_04160 [Ferroacidibacillus organovorans]OPG16548.1 hypothetical protein B2M26_06665 [Ferroacidibacillus organovorans]
MDTFEVLSQLVTLSGGPGDEGLIAARYQTLCEPYIQAFYTDSVGNCIGVANGEGAARPRVMLAAHMDEICLMVQAIEPGGFLRVIGIGGFDPRTLLGQEVTVHGTQAYSGIIGSKPPHLQAPEEREEAVPLKDIFLDLGMAEARVREVISLGDRVTLRRDPVRLINQRVAAKALDNRASVTAMLLALNELSHIRHNADVYAVATIQEEIGCKGAQTAAYGILPDLAIALDVCHGEMPGVESDLVQKVGGGPVISFGPHLHPKLFERLKTVATEQNIPYQIEVTQGATYTDADPIQIVQAGIPTALISIPLRYMHTSVETASLDDIARVGRLLARVIASLDAAFVEGLSCY